jgi:uncharacterized protein (TIGR02145 family)
MTPPPRPFTPRPQRRRLRRVLPVLSTLCALAWTLPLVGQTALNARVVGTTIRLELEAPDLSPAGLTFHYSEDGGNTWNPIPPACLVPVAGASGTWDWAVLTCLNREEFVGDRLRFKAVRATCTGPLTYQGYDYQLVEIAGQCWFAENLRAVRYRNGDPIPGNLSADRWAALTSGAQAVYGEKESNLLKYGRLYNGYAVDDSRGLCPSGWHVPSDAEWTALTDALGGWKVAGKKMKSTAWDGTNSSGFSALPGGFRSPSSGYFNSEGDYGSWWSSSAGGTDNAWNRDLYSGDGYVYRNNFNQRFGFSVRCVRDE